MSEGNLNYRVTNIPQPPHIQVSIIDFRVTSEKAGRSRMSVFSLKVFWAFCVPLEIKRMDPKTPLTPQDLAVTLSECFLLLRGLASQCPYGTVTLFPQDI